MEAEPNDVIVLGSIRRGTKKFSNIQNETKISPEELNSILEELENKKFITVEEKKGWFGGKIELKITEEGSNELDKKILDKVNLKGTKKLFEEIKSKTKSIIYISGLGVYGETGEKIIDENQQYNPNTNFVKIRLDAEKYLKENSIQNKIDFAVVHFGDVYGPDGWFYDMLVKRLEKNTFRMPKGGDYYKGFVHVDDAVGSMISVLEHKSFGESFIVADSMPITFKEFSNFTADQINAKHPGSVPIFLAKAVLGGDLIKLLTTSMKVSNKKISEIYEFKYPNYKDGIKQIISELKEKNRI